MVWAIRRSKLALHSNTLQVLRHYLSSAVGDLLYGQCGTTGATTSKIYASFLHQANDYYNQHHYEVYVYAGTNIGVTKRVTDWVLADLLLTVHSVYAVACDATSYIELHHIFTQDELRKAINLAIDSAADSYLVPLVDATTIKLTSTTDNLDNIIYTYEYDLPTTMTHLTRVTKERGVSGVKLTGTVSGTFTAGETITGGTSEATGELSYGVDGGTYIRVRKVDGTFVVEETATGGTSEETCSSITAVEYETAGQGVFYDEDEIDPRSWDIVKAYPSGTPSLKLNQSYFSSFDEDLYLRLEGQRRQPILTADTGICYLPPNWVVQKAITLLPQNKIQANDLAKTYTRAYDWCERHPIRNWPDPRARKVIE